MEMYYLKIYIIILYTPIIEVGENVKRMNIISKSVICLIKI